MVPEKNGSCRSCGDFRRLNLVTEADVYPLPNMLDFSDRLAGCKVLSKIDLRKGYWKIPVRPEDVQKTAVITPFGMDPWTARQCRHLAYVAEFTADIQHLAGHHNIAADALSRLPISTITTPSQSTEVVTDLR
jgi:hypothetical protein